MNTKKKIIYTLRSADKASVERLMAEAAKKDEIFAKVMERAEKDNEYTDVAEGAEQYNRRISIVHTASAAAASVLLVAGVWGAVHLLKSNKGLIDHHVGDNNMTIDMTDNVNNATAKNTTQNTKTTVFNVTSANENVTIVTATATADGTAKGTGGKTTETTTTTTTADNENTEVTTNAEAQQPEQKETGEQLREKCISAVYNYDKFSANYNFSTTMNDSALFLKFAGTIKIDNSSMTGELDRTMYTTNGNVYRNDYQYYLNDKFAFAADYNNGVLDANIKDMSRELPEGSIFDRVYFKEYQGLSTFTEDKLNGTRWEITGERNENGRNTTTVKIYYEDESSTVIIADIDAETGICIKYDKYENGEITESFTTSDRKFGEDAEVPKTEHEVKEIFESTYEPGMKEIYSDYKISDLN
jgi:hypothetical protein